MLNFEALCYAVSAVAELAGIVLIVREGRQARLVYLSYLKSTQVPSDPVMRVFMERSIQSSHYRLDAAERVVDHLLSTKARWVAAAVLLLAGVLFGTVGNFLGLGS